MKLDRVLTWFIWVWIALYVLSRLLVILVAGLVSYSFWIGFRMAAVTELNHFNPLYYPMFIAQILLLSPAIVALIWRTRRRKRIAN